jgi:hypothetical protein
MRIQRLLALSPRVSRCVNALVHADTPGESPCAAGPYLYRVGPFFLTENQGTELRSAGAQLEKVVIIRAPPVGTVEQQARDALREIRMIETTYHRRLEAYLCATFRYVSMEPEAW